jgi:hypothetical protein
MFGDGSLTFREFCMREPLPLATVHDALLEFLRGRDDAILCGAHAVNAYSNDPRMSQDVDILSPSATELVEELRHFLSQQFDMAIHSRMIREGVGYRLYQVRKPENRHLVDVYHITSLPHNQRIEEVRVLTPVELISSKVRSLTRRLKTPKGGTDLGDLLGLLLTFPELKTEEGPVTECLRAAGATDKVMAAWKDLVARKILPNDEDDGY